MAAERRRDRSFLDDVMVQMAIDLAGIADSEASQALESAGAMMDSKVDEETLKVVEEPWTEQQCEVTKVHATSTDDLEQNLVVGPKKAQMTKTESDK